MDIKRLRKIIQYGDCHKEEMEEKIRDSVGSGVLFSSELCGNQ